jgi:hypothetical protein
MAQNWQMPFASSRRYGSLTLQHDVAEMLRRRHAQTEQPAVILFVSDLDPSGIDLQRAWEEAMVDFGLYAFGCSFRRIALTREQVAAPELDLDGLSISVKPSDSRAEAFIEQYGNRCWEVDVLPGNVIEAAVNAEIRSWLETKAWKRRDKEIEHARKLL